MSGSSLPVGERPFRDDPVSTADLPSTPTREFRIPASAWAEAPEELLRLGDELEEPVEYKRRIGEYLLWRAGPPVGEAMYMAISASNPDRRFRFRLHGRTGRGIGPEGRVHTRFRSWKESLLGRFDGTPGDSAPQHAEGES